MNETVTLHLPQFAETDRIHHDDFNDAFAAIDTAVAANSSAIALRASTAALSAETQAREQALGAEATARQNADSALGGRIDSEAAARAAALAAVNANLGSHGHNCRIAYGSYNGTGSYGSASPNTLTFDFYPVAVIIGSDSEARNVANPTVLLRGRGWGVCDCAGGVASSTDTTLTLTWSDNGISWYNTASQWYQNNRSGAAYSYVVLGYDKAAEEA